MNVPLHVALNTPGVRGNHAERKASVEGLVSTFVKMG
jgi:hypothetical protein